MSPLNPSGLLNILLQDLLQCLSSLNGLDLKLKTLFLYIFWSFVRNDVCPLMSPLLLFILFFEDLKLNFYPLLLLVTRLSSFVWNHGGCFFPHLLSFHLLPLLRSLLFIINAHNKCVMLVWIIINME